MPLPTQPLAPLSGSGPSVLSLPVKEPVLQALHYCFLICDYLLLNPQFDLSRKVTEAGLIDRPAMEQFRRRSKELEAGQVAALSVTECIVLVTLFDIAGKCFVSNVMDEMRTYFTAAFGLTDSQFVLFRRFFLRLATAITSPVRAALQGVPPFTDAMHRLDTLPFSTD